MAMQVKRRFFVHDDDKSCEKIRAQRLELHSIQRPVAEDRKIVPSPLGQQITTQFEEVEVESDPASETKQEGETEKKKTKTVVERYWDWELTNETQLIWLRNSKEVTTEEYNEFYKKTFNEYLEPLASSHFTTEGEVEFRSILYVPSIAPTGKDDVVNPKTKNIRLYVKHVFISDDFDGELFPRYLSFVKGVVDSNDLPLNVSREILQESRIVRIMRKCLVRKAFDMILGISMSENRDDYEKFWENFGKHMKLGCIEDRENHKRIAPLLRFFSSQSEDMISLDEYVENMKPDQKDIYFIAHIFALSGWELEQGHGTFLKVVIRQGAATMVVFSSHRRMVLGRR